MPFLFEGLWEWGKSPHLFALGALEVHVAVALAAFRWSAELPQAVRLGRFGQAHVAERSGGDHHVGVHAVHVCGRTKDTR